MLLECEETQFHRQRQREKKAPSGECHFFSIVDNWSLIDYSKVVSSSFLLDKTLSLQKRASVMPLPEFYGAIDSSSKLSS